MEKPESIRETIKEFNDKIKNVKTLNDRSTIDLQLKTAILEQLMIMNERTKGQK